MSVLEPGQKFNRFVFAEFLRNQIMPLLNPYNGRNAHSVILLGNNILTTLLDCKIKRLFILLIICLFLADNHPVHHVSEVEELVEEISRDRKSVV